MGDKNLYSKQFNVGYHGLHISKILLINNLHVSRPFCLEKKNYFEFGSRATMHIVVIVEDPIIACGLFESYPCHASIYHFSCHHITAQQILLMIDQSQSRNHRLRQPPYRRYNKPL